MFDNSAPQEIETKFRLSDRVEFERRLANLGAAAGPAEFESNVLLDDAAGSLRTNGQALRLRESGGTSVVTFKGKATLDRGLKSRVEIESGVTNAKSLGDIFTALGFAPVFRYEKHRTTWRFPDPELPLVVVDETPLGLFAEIEGAEPAVRALAERLGVSQREMLVQSYPVLYQEARKENPELPKDMIFAGPPAGDPG